MKKLLVGALLGVAAVAAMNLPDLKRYLKMRAM
jgi:hypothetical protein